MRFSDDDEDADDEALPLALASLAAADERVVRLDALRGAEDADLDDDPFVLSRRRAERGMFYNVRTTINCERASWSIMQANAVVGTIQRRFESWVDRGRKLVSTPRTHIGGINH